MHTRRFASVIMLLAGFTISACSAFFVPNEDDDDVARCNTTEDCVEPEDNRYRAQCVFGEGQPQNSDKVCSSDFAEITCNPTAYSGDTWVATTFEDATSNSVKILYIACDAANEGKQGCAPGASGCNMGLTENADGICDVDGADIPAINPDNVGGTEIAGQDVKDAFCRAFFCDEEFVCDSSGSKQLCKRCDPSKPFGEGGCGTLYIQGAPSSVYIDADAGNCEGTIDPDDIVGGDAPMAP